MAASTQATSSKLFFLEEMSQYPDRIPTFFAESSPGVFGTVRVCEEAVEDPIRFKDSIFNASIFFLELKKGTPPSTVKPLNDNASLKQLDARIIAALSLISAETMTKATVAFADFQNRLPELLTVTQAPMGAEMGAQHIMKELESHQNSLTDSQKEVLKSCKTAEDVATKLIGTLTQQFKDETMIEQLLEKIMEKVTLSQPVNKEEYAQQIAVARVTKALNTVVAGLVHLSTLQK